MTQGHKRVWMGVLVYAKLDKILFALQMLPIGVRLLLLPKTYLKVRLSNGMFCVWAAWKKN